MAELALIASIVQVADIGIRLGFRLHTFGETVASADRSILAISKDVTFTSSVLQELKRTFENDTSKIHSDNATETAMGVVRECSAIFQEMDELMLKKMPQLRSGVVDKKAKARTMLERLKWPVIKDKIELLNCNLDRMKSTLTLMLNVIIFAQKVSKKDEPPSALAEQRQLIEILAEVKQQRDEALEQARRALQYNGQSTTMTVNFMAMSVECNGRSPGQGSPQTTTPSNELSSQDHLFRLLQEYTRLRERLTKEVHSKSYQIEHESRKRLQSVLESAHEDEVTRVKRLRTTPQELLQSVDISRIQGPASSEELENLHGDDVQTHTEKRMQKAPPTFPCHLCSKKFTRGYNLRSHLRTHGSEPPAVRARQKDRGRPYIGETTEPESALPAPKTMSSKTPVFADTGLDLDLADIGILPSVNIAPSEVDEQQEQISIQHSQTEELASLEADLRPSHKKTSSRQHISQASSDVLRPPTIADGKSDSANDDIVLFDENGLEQAKISAYTADPQKSQKRRRRYFSTPEVPRTNENRLVSRLLGRSSGDTEPRPQTTASLPRRSARKFATTASPKLQVQDPSAGVISTPSQETSAAHMLDNELRSPSLKTKEDVWQIDHDLSDMSGLVDPKFGEVFQGTFSGGEDASPTPGAWDAPDSWAVKKIGDGNVQYMCEIDEADTPGRIEGTPTEAEDVDKVTLVRPSYREPPETTQAASQMNQHRLDKGDLPHLNTPPEYGMTASLSSRRKSTPSKLPIPEPVARSPSAKSSTYSSGNVIHNYKEAMHTAKVTDVPASSSRIDQKSFGRDREDIYYPPFAPAAYSPPNQSSHDPVPRSSSANTPTYLPSKDPKSMPPERHSGRWGMAWDDMPQYSRDFNSEKESKRFSDLLRENDRLAIEHPLYRLPDDDIDHLDPDYQETLEAMAGSEFNFEIGRLDGFEKPKERTPAPAFLEDEDGKEAERHRRSGRESLVLDRQGSPSPPPEDGMTPIQVTDRKRRRRVHHSNNDDVEVEEHAEEAQPANEMIMEEEEEASEETMMQEGEQQEQEEEEEEAAEGMTQEEAAAEDVAEDEAKPPFPQETMPHVPNTAPKKKMKKPSRSPSKRSPKPAVAQVSAFGKPPTKKKKTMKKGVDEQEKSNIESVVDRLLEDWTLLYD